MNNEHNERFSLKILLILICSHFNQKHKYLKRLEIDNFMENKTISKPPYPSTGQADEILDIFRRIIPKKIDSKFVAENKIATPANAASVVNFVRWLGIIDSENKVNEDIANKLRHVGEEREKFIADLIKGAYEDVFERVNLQQATRDDLTNFFIHNYKYGPAPAKNSSILLLHLCEKYGIPVSDELKKKTYTFDSSKSRERKTLGKSEKLNPKKIESKNGNEKIEGIIIRIPNSGLTKEYIINSREEFDNVFNIELKKAEKIIKINFDWNDES